MPAPLGSLPTPDRVGVSTISFRHRSLDDALRHIAATGAVEIDLGAIPDVTDHVPVPFAGDADAVAAQIASTRLRTGAVNADPGDLNDPDLTPTTLREVVAPLADLAEACGAALIVPAGRASYTPFVEECADLARIAENLGIISDQCRQRGVRLLVEALHHRRYVHTVERAEALLALCGPETVGLVFDVSHVVASSEDPVDWIASRADRIERVHLRDAVPGALNLSLGAGSVDFAAVVGALEAEGYSGTYILELETHDIEEAAREDDAQRSRDLVVSLLDRSPSRRR